MRGEIERGKGREREERKRVERQWDPLSLGGGGGGGVNSCIKLVGASKRNHFPKIHLFYFVTFWGPIF